MRAECRKTVPNHETGTSIEDGAGVTGEGEQGETESTDDSEEKNEEMKNPERYRCQPCIVYNIFFSN